MPREKLGVARCETVVPIECKRWFLLEKQPEKTCARHWRVKVPQKLERTVGITVVVSFPSVENCRVETWVQVTKPVVVSLSLKDFFPSIEVEKSPPEENLGLDCPPRPRQVSVVTKSSHKDSDLLDRLRLRNIPSFEDARQGLFTYVRVVGILEIRRMERVDLVGEYSNVVADFLDHPSNDALPCGKGGHRSCKKHTANDLDGL
jgi:hypothetical protein